MRLASIIAVLLLTTVPAMPQQPVTPTPRQTPAGNRVVRRRAAMRFEATAFSQTGLTRKGTITHDGVVAADPAVLPLGSVIRISEAGTYSGRYVVTDTGSKIRGRHIDVYIPNQAEARQFGKKVVTVELLVRGNNEKNDHIEVTPASATPVAPDTVAIARK